MRSFLAVVLVICLIVLAWCGRIYIQQKSLGNADQVELRATFDRWIEAGRPSGEALSKFMRGRRSDLVVNTQIFLVKGTNYSAQFALTNQMSGNEGLLVITTNKILLQVGASGSANIIDSPVHQ